MRWGWVNIHFWVNVHFKFTHFLNCSHCFCLEQNVLKLLFWCKRAFESQMHAKSNGNRAPSLPRVCLLWYFQHTMVCGALITFHVLFRIDSMQISCSAASCCCSFFVIVTFGLERFHTSNRKLRCCMCIFQHFGKHLCQQPWLFPACVWCKFCLMCVTSYLPLRERISDAAFPCLVKGDGRSIDRCALESRWVSTYQ